MNKAFAEVSIYQVKPTKIDEFEKLLESVVITFTFFLSILNLDFVLTS